MFRRDFMGGLTSTLALCGCSLPPETIEKNVADCTTPYVPGDILRIDAHTHVLNGRDNNGKAFLGRASVGLTKDTVGVGYDLENTDLVGFFDFEKSNHPLGPFAKSLKKEIDALEDLAKTNPADNSLLCREAAKDQKVLGSALTDDGYLGGPTGFLRDRLRNASLMMIRWPEVDMFAVSMVDFREVQDGHDPFDAARQADFYELLHRASYGRCLPLISFQPERDRVRVLDEDGRATGESRRYLDLVRDALENQGFIGVKLHPSVGFDPWDNFEFGCDNTARHNDQEKERFKAVYDAGGIKPRTAEEVRQRAEIWNKNLRDLYRLCEELDVPILTHNSMGLSRNPQCMMPKEVDPVNWTNSAAHWVKLLDPKIDRFPDISEQTGIQEYPDEDYRKPRWKNLRVCLGHFAAGFFPVSKDDPTLKPGPWLTAATEFIERDRRGALWLDLSAMKRLLTDQDQSKAFQTHVNAHPKLVDQILYGTDWHMPPSNLKGYRAAFEGKFSPRARSKVMGRNAVDFYGLARGRMTHRRLLDYYDRHGIALKDVRWYRRLQEKGLA